MSTKEKLKMYRMLTVTLLFQACYDVRESSAFWDLMELKENYAEQAPPPEFLSTHPSSKNRAQTLDDLLSMVNII